jgi:hypothetical protein
MGRCNAGGALARCDWGVGAVLLSRSVEGGGCGTGADCTLTGAGCTLTGGACTTTCGACTLTGGGCTLAGGDCTLVGAGSSLVAKATRDRILQRCSIGAFTR